MEIKYWLNIKCRQIFVLINRLLKWTRLLGVVVVVVIVVLLPLIDSPNWVSRCYDFRMKRETEPVNVNVPVSFWLNGPNHTSHPRKKKNVILVLQLATRSSDDITLRFSTLAQPPPLKDGLGCFFFLHFSSSDAIKLWQASDLKWTFPVLREKKTQAATWCLACLAMWLAELSVRRQEAGKVLKWLRYWSFH